MICPRTLLTPAAAIFASPATHISYRMGDLATECRPSRVERWSRIDAVTMHPRDGKGDRHGSDGPSRARSTTNVRRPRGDAGRRQTLRAHQRGVVRVDWTDAEAPT